MEVYQVQVYHMQCFVSTIKYYQVYHMRKYHVQVYSVQCFVNYAYVKFTNMEWSVQSSIVDSPVQVFHYLEGSEIQKKPLKVSAQRWKNDLLN